MHLWRISSQNQEKSFSCFCSFCRILYCCPLDFSSLNPQFLKLLLSAFLTSPSVELSSEYNSMHYLSNNSTIGNLKIHIQVPQNKPWSCTTSLWPQISSSSMASWTPVLSSRPSVPTGTLQSNLNSRWLQDVVSKVWWQSKGWVPHQIPHPVCVV